jgi:hypothetical protein
VEFEVLVLQYVAAAMIVMRAAQPCHLVKATFEARYVGVTIIDLGDHHHHHAEAIAVEMIMDLHGAGIITTVVTAVEADRGLPTVVETAVDIAREA